MKNVNNWIWYLIILVASIAIPPALNLALGCDTPNGFNVIGNSVDWLLFYGSYLGGVITAVFGFVTMHKSGRQNKTNIEITYKRESLKELRNTLATCVSSFDYTRLGTINMYIDDPDKYNDVLEKLDEYYASVTNTANAWCAMYNGDTREEVENFLQAYRNCSVFLTNRIKEIKDAINTLKKARLTHDKEAEKTAKDEIETIIDKYKKDDISNFELNLQVLIGCATQWIIAEQKEIEKLEAQL